MPKHSLTHTALCLSIAGAVAVYLRFVWGADFGVSIAAGSVTGFACITIKEIRDFQKPQSGRTNTFADFRRDPAAFDWAGWVLPSLGMLGLNLFALTL